MIIINYAVKLLIIAIGILLLGGWLYNSPENRILTQVMGVVFILWGTYRIIIYRLNLKRYKEFEDEEDEQ